MTEFNPMLKDDTGLLETPIQLSWKMDKKNDALPSQSGKTASPINSSFPRLALRVGTASACAGVAPARRAN